MTIKAAFVHFRGCISIFFRSVIMNFILLWNVLCSTSFPCVSTYSLALLPFSLSQNSILTFARFCFSPFQIFSIFFFSMCKITIFAAPQVLASIFSQCLSDWGLQPDEMAAAYGTGSGAGKWLAAQLALRLRRWGCSRHPHPSPSWQQKQEHQQGHCSTLGHRNTFVEESAHSIPQHAKRTALSHWSANESSGGCWQDTLTPGPTCTLQWLQVKQTEPSASSSCPYWDPQSCYCVQTNK